ncbi:MAG: helix-turn-helix domain-containing protein [Terriglobia bacterium]
MFPPAPNPGWVQASDARSAFIRATGFNLARTTHWRYIQNGSIPAVKFFGRWYVSQNTLDKMIETFKIGEGVESVRPDGSGS